MTNASFPLMVMRLSAGELSLRMRPAVIARLVFGVEPLAVAPAPGVVVFPARSWMSRYIGIRKDGVVVGYFSRADPAVLLSAVSAAGFQVEWAEEKVARF